MADVAELHLNSDTVVNLKNLKNHLGQLLNTTDFPGATVTMRVLDSANSPVTGVADPISLAEVAGYRGWWRGFIAETAAVAAGDRGTLVITVDDAAGGNAQFTRQWRVPVVT